MAAPWHDSGKRGSRSRGAARPFDPESAMTAQDGARAFQQVDVLTDRAGFGNALEVEVEVEVEVDSGGGASGGTSVTCVEGTLRF
jgi:hypothetical protein